MSIISDLISGAIAAVLGFFAKKIWNAFKTRNARRFWKKITKNDFCVVVGRFRSFGDFEKSGLVGGSDMQASIELRLHFANAGLPDFDVMFADQLLGDELKKNLIVIGLADYESLGKLILPKIKSTLGLGDVENDEITIYDHKDEKIYAPVVNSKTRDIETDYAIIIKANNPFNPENSIVLVSGGFGTGTWAGFRYLMGKDVYKNAIIKSGKNFECLVEADIVKGFPQQVRALQVREL